MRPSGKHRHPQGRETRSPADLQEPDISPPPEPEVRTHSIQVTQVFWKHKDQNNTAALIGKSNWPAFLDTAPLALCPVETLRWRSGSGTQNLVCPRLASPAPINLRCPIAANPAFTPPVCPAPKASETAPAGFVWDASEVPPQQTLPCPPPRPCSSARPGPLGL